MDKSISRCGITDVPNSNLIPLRVATRASRLAMWQAHHVAALLRTAAPDRVVEIVPLSTIGDRDKTEPLTRLGGSGGMGVFTREIQAALLDRRGDLAVHSLKDLPTEPTDGLVLAAVPTRGAMFDVLVLPASASEQCHTADVESDSSGVSRPSLTTLLSMLSANARVGTGSPRRMAQLRHVRPDLQFLEARGNVETRLRKLDEGQFDALVLAEAGLARLELAGRMSVLLRPPFFYPAVGQGALGIECRADDSPLREILKRLIDRSALLSVLAERMMLSTLRAGCHAPLGVWTRPDGDSLRLTAVVLSLDGTQRFEAERCSIVVTDEDAVTLGRGVAEDLLRQGAAEVMSASTVTFELSEPS